MKKRSAKHVTEKTKKGYVKRSSHRITTSLTEKFTGAFNARMWVCVRSTRMP